MKSNEGPNITQIVPRLPPAIDGVGDYAANLAKRLHKNFGYRTHFVIGDSAWKEKEYQDSFSVSRVAERSEGALLSCLRGASNTVLLHYVGYGYEKRGCPQWLVDGLELWRHTGGERKLVTMFHEVYAFGPIWTSSFWLAPLQKRLAGRLARLSSHCLTNREEYADFIHRLDSKGGKQVTVLPVFSNVGESDEMPSPLAKRKRRLVVFGSRGHRQLVFQKSLIALIQTCRAFNVEEVVDIGARVEHGISRLNEIPLRQAGVLSAREVSALLSDSIIGFFNYPTDYLGKSTIFAAYCAHRLLPVGVYSTERQMDGLSSGKHFWLAGHYKGEWSLAAGQTIADNAYQWYQEHNLFKQAKVFTSCLKRDKGDIAGST
jgi:hypothetical protein